MTVKWHKVSHEQLYNYESDLSRCLTVSIDNIPIDKVHCFIDKLDQSIITSINEVSASHLPHSSYRPYLKTYWSDSLKQCHALMRIKRRAWIDAGRPRDTDHDSYKAYTDVKRCFRKIYRNSSFKYLQQINEDIDTASGVDSPLCWRLFQNKNKTVNNNVCNEIKFNGIVFRDPESICHEWGRHFASLYSDTECDSYDNTQFEDVTARNSIKVAPIV